MLSVSGLLIIVLLGSIDADTSGVNFGTHEENPGMAIEVHRAPKGCLWIGTVAMHLASFDSTRHQHKEASMILLAQYSEQQGRSSVPRTAYPLI